MLLVAGVLVAGSAVATANRHSTPDVAAVPAARAVTPASPPVVPPSFLRVLPLGDSITAGPDSSGHLGGWRAIVWQRLIDQEHLAVQFVGTQHSDDPPLDHEGHGGWRTDQLRGIVDGVLAATTPDVVLLQAGVNDLAQGVPVATTTARLGDLAARICLDRPRAILFLASLLPAGGLPWQVDALNQTLPDVVAGLQDSGCAAHLVDMHSAVSVADLYDGAHPGPDGYAAMADVWSAQLEDRLRNGSPEPRRPGTIDDDALHYLGTWRAEPGRHRSESTGDTATLVFWGTGVTLRGGTGPDGGMAAVAVDGVEKEVDAWSADVRDQVPLRVVTGLPAGAHTIVLRVEGRSAGASTGTAVTVEGLTVEQPGSAH